MMSFLFLQVIKLIDKPSAQQNGQDQSESEDGGDVWQVSLGQSSFQGAPIV